ncbi:HIRAN domain-containing protein [Sphingomonas guangdongensis]|jgi:hypothetical protein|uniref:HIRAN domain-containing protein n=1 Tax=Sphingomonas guangdongensis TaxID=1141890 RepID=A0A285R1R1_9SPHN|nr:HIRAN domain-containing protein [Sphingomonas guangdongensis]GLK22314.1 hypothetical protein GCM10017606_31420 [Microbacterium terregens]SOB88025.1 HIRAN domain-containing protein [Sphingomonas guangdongensis]
MKQMSLHVVGANHPNADGGNRRFEILLCGPGEPIELVPEPKNPADPHAIAVFSSRNVQIGYLTADRAPWIGGMLRNGRPVEVIFQAATSAGAAVRIAFDGDHPVLPPAHATGATPPNSGTVEFWPDEIYPDD